MNYLKTFLKSYKLILIIFLMPIFMNGCAKKVNWVPVDVNIPKMDPIKAESLLLESVTLHFQHNSSRYSGWVHNPYIKAVLNNSEKISSAPYIGQRKTPDGNQYVYLYKNPALLGGNFLYYYFSVNPWKLQLDPPKYEYDTINNRYSFALGGDSQLCAGATNDEPKINGNEFIIGYQVTGNALHANSTMGCTPLLIFGTKEEMLDFAKVYLNSFPGYAPLLY